MLVPWKKWYKKISYTFIWMLLSQYLSRCVSYKHNTVYSLGSELNYSEGISSVKIIRTVLGSTDYVSYTKQTTNSWGQLTR